MIKLLILICLSFVMCHLAMAQGFPELDKVKEIKLLESNRDDVRKILATYKMEISNGSKYYDNFETNNFEIEVSYSDGRCSSNISVGYDVDEWIVDGIIITPKNSIKLNDFKLNISQYRKEKVFYDEPDLYAFYNKELGVVFKVFKNEVDEINFTPSKKNYSKMCNKEDAEKLFKSKSIFTDPLKRRSKIVCHLQNLVPNVNNLILSFSKVTASCSSPNNEQNEKCSEGFRLIKIFTDSKDMDGDILTYNYTVSGGKIIGTGEKVLWDLSGVKPGTYTITAAVDDGCGYCGKTMTKTVTVKKCPNCKVNNN